MHAADATDFCLSSVFFSSWKKTVILFGFVLQKKEREKTLVNRNDIASASACYQFHGERFFSLVLLSSLLPLIIIIIIECLFFHLASVVLVFIWCVCACMCVRASAAAVIISFSPLDAAFVYIYVWNNIYVRTAMCDFSSHVDQDSQNQNNLWDVETCAFVSSGLQRASWHHTLIHTTYSLWMTPLHRHQCACMRTMVFWDFSDASQDFVVFIFCFLHSF